MCPRTRCRPAAPLGPLKADGSVGLGVDLMAQLGDAVRARNIPILFGHRAVRLVLDDARRVVGIEAESGAEVVSIRARKAVIFATGGYVHNAEFVENYQRNRIYGSCAMPWATGDFINIAGAAGARMGNMSGAWRTQIVLDEALQSSKSGRRAYSSRLAIRWCRSTGTGCARSTRSATTTTGPKRTATSMPHRWSFRTTCCS